MTEKGKVQFGEHLTPRQEMIRSAVTSGPGIAWVCLFLLLPLVGIAAISFLSRGAYGQIQATFTLENFRRFIGFGAFGYDPVYLWVTLRSLAMAAGTALLCLAAAFPLAFFIARLPASSKQLGLMLVVIPFWTNLLIRTYAWQIILSGTGWLAQGAASLGFINPGAPLYPGAFAVFLGLTCDYLPFMVLPLYASVERIDWALAEAASDLGANGWGVFRHAVLPQVRPGLTAGIILVSVPATGQFIIPDLLGGAKTALLGSAIQQQFGPSRDWPFGSAITCLTMLIVMGALWVYARSSEKTGEVLL
jgi:spermidine/putrescine transport system permease protein